jgi:hypothetical protein
LRDAAWELANLVVECEIMEAEACKVFWIAAREIKNKNDFSNKELQDILDGAFKNVRNR